MQKVQIILGSIRQGRQGEKVARWIYEQATQRPEIEAELVDLRDWPLPFFNETMPPRQLSSELVSSWIAKVSEADAYIIVVPEYNHSFPAVLKNALDYGFKSWRNKPVTFVAYSGDSTGGARVVEQLRQVAVELQMAPIREAIYFPSIWEQFDANGQPRNSAIQHKTGPFFEQLLWWSRALQKARQGELALAA